MKNNIKILLMILSVFSLSSCNPSPDIKVETVTVTLNPNGGTISKNKVTVEKGTPYNEDLFPTPTKSHYTFSYWSYDNDEDIPIENTYSIVNDVTIKAQYVENITVSFDTDGGSTLSPVEIGKGTIYKASLFQTPTKTGYKFSYWMIDDKKIDDVYMFNSSVTLKAYYTVKEETEDEQYIKSLNIKRINNLYLYESTFNDADYSVGSKYFGYGSSKNYLLNLGKTGCSGVVFNNYFGRNFDLAYSTYPEFIVQTNYPTSLGRYNSIGISYMPQFTNISEIGTTKNVGNHKLIPFLTMDGINEKGLTICINEVPSMDTEVGRCKGTAEDKPKMSSIMLVRYLLDYASSVDDAKEKLKEYSFVSLNYYNELHYLIADSSGKSAVIEFKKRSDSTLSDIVFYENSKEESNPFKGVMTNFTFNNYKGDAKDYYNHRDNLSLTLHAEGVERYNLLMKALYEDSFTVNSLDTMLDLMKLVYYTKSYTIELTDDSPDFWYTEFNYTSSNTIKSDHTVSAYSSLVNGYKKNFHNWDGSESRNYSFYCSRHSVAYDLNNLEMKIIFEETNKIDNVYKVKVS